jgi:hypothetical protein
VMPGVPDGMDSDFFSRLYSWWWRILAIIMKQGGIS